jgi:hypothetical protein
MMHKGARIRGGDMPDDLIVKVDGLLDQFMGIVEEIAKGRDLLRGIVRSQVPSSIVVALDTMNLYVLAQANAGSLSTLYTYHPNRRISPEEAMSSAKWEFKFEDPFMLVFSKQILDQPDLLREGTLRAMAATHVESEVERALHLMSLMQIRPLFGHASYMVKDLLATVLVPATESGTDIYEETILPLIESGGLEVYRAEEFEGDEKKLREIWRNICIARIIVADLTGADPLVMYELGISHTVGKQAILLCRRGECPKFPEELIKSKIIEYDSGEDGMEALRSELAKVLNEAFRPLVG